MTNEESAQLIGLREDERFAPLRERIYAARMQQDAWWQVEQDALRDFMALVDELFGGNNAQEVRHESHKAGSATA